MSLSDYAVTLRIGLVLVVALFSSTVSADDESPAQAFVDGTGPGWRSLGEEDFENVNCNDDTWTWDDEGLHCTGRPIGVNRSTQQYENFELVLQWRHLRDAGNSGVFIWAPEEELDKLTEPGLPAGGIEVQILDLAYGGENPAGWYTSHGDIFAVGVSTMSPFPPLSPNGGRSFPSEDRTLGVNQWNHYYIRCINGEIRLWVNGKEVSGGNECNPSSGYICLESEGAPIDFKDLRIRELP